jgi:hypothetical protein
MCQKIITWRPCLLLRPHHFLYNFFENNFGQFVTSPTFCNMLQRNQNGNPIPINHQVVRPHGHTKIIATLAWNMPKTLSSLLLEVEIFDNCILVFMGVKGSPKESYHWHFKNIGITLNPFSTLTYFVDNWLQHVLQIPRMFYFTNWACNIHKIKVGPHLKITTSSGQAICAIWMAWNAQKMLQITHIYSYIYNTRNVHNINILKNLSIWNKWSWDCNISNTMKSIDTISSYF